MSPASTTFDRRPVTDALIAMLEAAIPVTVDRTILSKPAPGKVVGDHTAPLAVAGEGNPRLPYCAVYGLPGGVPERSWTGDGDIAVTYQVTSVGDQRNQAEALSDLVRSLILDVGAVGHQHAITPAGRSKVIGRFLESAGAPSQEGKLWNVVDLFHFDLSIT